MKNIIGLVKISVNKNSQISLKVYLAKGLTKIIGKEIVFNCREMVMKRPTLDSRNVHRANGSAFSFMPPMGAVEDYIGVYDVIQKDEDTFKLKRQKHA